MENNDLENQFLLLAKDIYQKITDFVAANKGDDEKFYENAILKLNDGRKIVVPFNNSGLYEFIMLDNIKSDINKGLSGDKFFIGNTKEFGFSASVEIFDSKKDDRISLVVDGKKQEEKKNFSQKEIREIKEYMGNLYAQIESIEYDKENTQSIANYNKEEREKYSKEQVEARRQSILEQLNNNTNKTR